jgi:hypothetical protein
MSERERRFLESAVESAARAGSTANVLGWATLWGAGGIASTLAGIAIVSRSTQFSSASAQVLGYLAAAVCFLGAVASVLFLIMLIGGHTRWRRVRQQWRDQDVPEIREALKDGRVRVRAFEATAVIEIDQWDDEGGGYLFQVGPDEVLVLRGQIYEWAEEGAAWPNSAFELVRTVHANRWVGIFCSGEALRPLRSVPPKEGEEGVAPADREEVVRGTLESVAGGM